MAGAYGLTPYGKGNITPKAEFNVYTDPLAAKIVFSSETEKYLIGLDITQKPDALLNEDDMNMLRDSGKNGKLIHNMLKTLFYASGGAVPLHDPHTIIYLIKPEIYKFRRYFIDVEIYGENTYGEIVVDDREKVPEWLKQGFPSYICIDVDGEEFKKELFNTIL
jgi:inosine-uridine nucleoside N-ribohydrolase